MTFNITVLASEDWTIQTQLTLDNHPYFLPKELDPTTRTARNIW